MNKRKVNTLVHIMIILAIFLPIILVLLTYFRAPITDGAEILQFIEVINDRFTLSNSIRTDVILAFNTFGIGSHSAQFYMLSTMISNALVIYFGWLCAEVMLFIPKFALKIIRRCTDI